MAHLKKGQVPRQARHERFASVDFSTRTFLVRDPKNSRCRALALALALTDWTVVVSDDVDREALDALIVEVWDAGGRIRAGHPL